MTTPSLGDEVAFISGVLPDGTLPLDAFYAWNGDNPATYTGGFTDSAKWGMPTAGTAGGTIHYYFNPASHWSATEKKMFVAGLTLWSDIANISFAPASNAAHAQIYFTRGNDGEADTNPSETGSSSAAGRTGSSTLLTLTFAAISIDTSVPGFGPINGTFTARGGYPIMTLLHEEGHAIGLGHAGPYNGSVNAAIQQFSAYDTRLWSIMSYIEPQTTSAEYFSQYTVTGTSWSHNDPTGLMPLDILAAQALYGAPKNTPLSGGQIFGFHCNVAGASEPFFDFTKNIDPIVTLWDKGKGNTLDLSGYTLASTVDLLPGTFSSCDGMTNNLCVAFNTKIDKAIGGAGNDSFIANNDGDTLYGGAGNDTLSGGTGKDTISGGPGVDHMAGGLGNDTYAVDNVGDVVTEAANAGIDTINTTLNSYTLPANVENLTYTGTGSFAGTGNNLANAITGGSGADTLTGSGGADHLAGGEGADLFVYAAAADSTGTHYDTITGFDALADKFDVPGTITGVDAAVMTGALSTATFNADLAAAVAPSHLAAHHAVEFTPVSGTLAGDQFLIVDLNGVAGYQANADLVILLHIPVNLTHLATGDFI